MKFPGPIRQNPKLPHRNSNVRFTNQRTFNLPSNLRAAYGAFSVFSVRACSYHEPSQAFTGIEIFALICERVHNPTSPLSRAFADGCIATGRCGHRARAPVQQADRWICVCRAGPWAGLRFRIARLNPTRAKAKSSRQGLKTKLPSGRTALRKPLRKSPRAEAERMRRYRQNRVTKSVTKKPQPPPSSALTLSGQAPKIYAQAPEADRARPLCRRITATARAHLEGTAGARRGDPESEVGASCRRRRGCADLGRVLINLLGVQWPIGCASRTKADTGRLCSTNLHRLVTKPGIRFFLPSCQRDTPKSTFSTAADMPSAGSTP